MKPVVKIIAGVAVVAALAAVVLTGTAKEAQAPAAQYTSLKGERITQQSLQGKVVLVNFWFPSCPGCAGEMPKLVDTYKHYQDKGFTTVAVAMNIDPPATVAAFSQQFGLPFFVAFDSDGSLAKQFGDVTVAPVSFLIDKRGHIVQRYLGEPDMDKLHALIEEKLREA